MNLIIMNLITQIVYVEENLKLIVSLIGLLRKKWRVKIDSYMCLYGHLAIFISYFDARKINELWDIEFNL